MAFSMNKVDKSANYAGPSQDNGGKADHCM